MPKSGLSMHAVHLALQGCMHADVQLSSLVAQVRAAGLALEALPQQPTGTLCAASMYSSISSCKRV